uniref:SET domain-containing protein n=2 Tax=Globodera TaxID=31242 RepID=A0A914HVB6_GLORO
MKKREGEKKGQQTLCVCHPFGASPKKMQEKKKNLETKKEAKQKKLKEPTPENALITNYFPIRRSKRMTTKEIEDLKTKQIKYFIDTGVSRSVRALKSFQRGEFVVEYKGDIINIKTAHSREQGYACDENVGSFMYYFRHRDNVFCVDATTETSYKGRLINHSYLKPNLKTRVADFGCSDFHLILVARRDIDIGEELLYDYGERRPEILAKNQWILNSRQFRRPIPSPTPDPCHPSSPPPTPNSSFEFGEEQSAGGRREKSAANSIAPVNQRRSNHSAGDQIPNVNDSEQFIKQIL